MAKKKETDKRTIKLGLNAVSDDVHEALNSLTSISSGMNIDQMISAAEVIKNECGESANVYITDDDYCGSDFNVDWTRLETDEEVQKRMTKSAKQRKTAAENRKTKKTQKVIDDKAELARLRKIYPDD